LYPPLPSLAEHSEARHMTANLTLVNDFNLGKGGCPSTVRDKMIDTPIKFWPYAKLSNVKRCTNAS